MPVLILTLAASGPETTRYDVRHFSDCRTASIYAASHPTVGRYLYHVTAKLMGARTASAGNGRFQGRGTAVLALGASQLQLPRWTWPQSSAAQRAAYDSFAAALRVHEVGHRTIARAAIQNQVLALTVLARSREAAEHALRSALATQLRATSDELLQKEELYDRVTEHGKRQSDGPLYGFPGGDDVVFSCP